MLGAIGQMGRSEEYVTNRLVLIALPLLSCSSMASQVSDNRATPVGVLHVLVQRLDPGGPVPVAQKGSLHGGDKLVMSAVTESLAPSYLYVLQQTAAGTFETLVPATNQAPMPTKPDELVQLPGDGKWFQLDQRIGEEVLYVVASEHMLEQSAVLKLIRSGLADGTRDPPPEIPPPRRGPYFLKPEERAAVRHGFFSTQGVAVVRFQYRHD